MSRIPPDSRETVDLFLTAIADAIADRLEHRQEARRQVLDMDQAVEYLGTSEDTIYRLIAERSSLPYVSTVAPGSISANWIGSSKTARVRTSTDIPYESALCCSA